ncbi:MAG: BlaI/MecI/CopY family transcriptional regulator [Flavobacteriaceae bacterium]|nr:BlaI/MecI/CopY family transcriptional regulator [Flavobacteriaceae bacterium]
MKTLTKAEEEIMHYLWELGKTNVAGILEKMPEPKPAYNTVSTIIRILETKNFVSHEAAGKGYLYFPLVQKAEYSQFTLTNMANDYFGGSFKSMVSFFVNKKELSLHDLENILKEIENKKDKL